MAQRPLRGGVQQNAAVPFVDTIEAGNIAAVTTRDGRIYCDWMQGACDELHAYVLHVKQGGQPRSDCFGPMQRGVELERQAHQVMKSSQQSFAIAKRLGELDQERDSVLARVPRDCFGAQPRPTSPSRDPLAQCLKAVGDVFCQPASAQTPPTSEDPNKLVSGAYDVYHLTHTEQGKARLRQTGTARIIAGPLWSTISTGGPPQRITPAGTRTSGSGETVTVYSYGSPAKYIAFQRTNPPPGMSAAAWYNVTWLNTGQNGSNVEEEWGLPPSKE